jgi:alpha-glucosidase
MLEVGRYRWQSGEVYSPPMTLLNRPVSVVGALLAILAALGAPEVQTAQTAQTPPAPSQQTPPATRRSQRVRMTAVQVASPNGRLRFDLLPNAERLTFTVTLDNAPILDPSPIVFQLDGYDLSTGVVLNGEERIQGEDRYAWRGPSSTATNRFKGVRLSLTNDLTSIAYTLEVRAFDDGVAFRHVVPAGAGGSRVPDEYTTFNIPSGSTVWYAGMEGHYEAPYLRKENAAIEPGEWAGPPMTFALPQRAAYAAITEANLLNYSGMALEANGRGGWVTGLGHRQPLNYPFELRYGREEGKRLGKAAAIDGEITTPWRVVIAGRDLNTLATSSILPNLCPPPDPALFPQGIDTPWAKAGRAVWRYVDGGPTGFDGMKTFSTLAAKLGFEYHVIEGLWAKWTPAEQREIVEFSRQQNVGLIFWRHTNQLRTPEARDAFFKMLRDLGVSGAKLDFFDHEAKEVVDLYEALLRKAAEYHIALVFHGSNKPTGRERTWPNELVRESVRGMESSAMMERARHQTILPFTRYLAGPADYTTMLFTERRRDSSVAHQIASLAVFASPLLTVAANPESILASPAADVIKSIPPVWDETMVLPDSAIGELVVYARRTGRTWFLAVMCGPAAKTIRVPLSFLGAGSYQAALVSDDAPDGSTIKVEQITRTRVDTIELQLAAGGGLLGRFTPVASR